MPESVVFEHYEVLTRDDGSLYELGRGAMGVTYKAFDTSLRVPVALKVINATYLHSEVARERFVREAQSAAKLRHRNVATVYHLGTESDAWFYAMEFIDGETVEALVRRHGALEPALALQIAAQVCRALNAAMPHALVHRDIKPANLMLVREDDELVVKVIDFGLALSAAPGEAAQDSSFVGTPHFASPEQLANREFDVRSDLYSLGVTLWLMLAGRTPFTGTVEQVKKLHLTKPPPFDELPHLTEPVLAVLRKALEKDPAKRHQTPQEFRRALEEASAQISTQADSAAIDAGLSGLLDDACGTPFEPGTVLAGRYKILEPTGVTNTGRTFRGYDREQQRDVRLVILHAEITGDAFTHIEHEVEKIAATPHENLLRFHELATADGASFLVLEWTEGFTLLELLRTRRELDAGETLALLQQAARGTDHALASGLLCLDFALHQIALHFPQSTDREKLLRTPLLAWPPFLLKLNPLGLSQELAAASQTWAGGQTMVQSGTAAGEVIDVRARYLRSLGAIAYELLGGASSPLQTAFGTSVKASRYTPLATLSEEGNEVLKRALNPAQSYASAEEFHLALKSVDVLSTRPPTHIHAPPPARAPAPRRPEAGGRSSRDAEAAPRGAASVSREARPPVAPTPPPAAKPARKLPVKVIGGALVLLGLAAGAYFLAPREAQPNAPETLGASPTPISEQRVAPEPTPVPPTPLAAATPAPPRATPPPVAPAPLTREVALHDALAAAEAAEHHSDPGQAVAAWLRVAHDFPESDIPRRRLDFVIDPLRKRPELQKPEAFAPLKPLLVEAAQLDSLSAVLLLAEALRTSSVQESFAWYSTAAARGRPEAALQLGLLLSNGVDGPPELEKALHYFTVAAEANDPAAKTALAECYLLGKGTAPDAERGMKWLREAADQGSLRALNRLADSYNRGRNGLPTNYDEAFRLWARVVETKDPTGQFRKPIGEAHGNLGTLYLSGHGTTADEARAVQLFREGVRLDDPGSMYYLGVCTLEGSAGLPKNAAEGRALILRGAEGRHVGAQNWCRKYGVPFTVK